MWLVRKFKLQDREELVSFIEYEAEEVENRGRSRLPLNIRQEIYDFWVSNSHVSTYRSNNRHSAKIHKSNMPHSDITDKDVRDVDKNSKQVQCHHKFVSKPYRVLHNIFRDTHPNLTTSFVSFCNMKPFYITPVTIKEMESCLCVVCCNNHRLYNAVRWNIKRELPRSLSDYLCETITCPRKNFINYHDIECISGTCENKCKIRSVMRDLKKEVTEANKLKNKISYFVFEPVTTFYFNKNGEKVSYDQTTRVNKHETLEEIVQKLEMSSASYLKHQFLDRNYSYYWKNFLRNSKFHTLWLDYSQNLAFKEKKTSPEC